MNKKKAPIVYIAGPMSGIPNWNYDAFNAAADRLKAEGYDVRNPAQKDVEMGYDETEAKATGDTARSIAEGVFDFREAYMWDVTQIIHGDAIYMLRGWERSPGAVGEHAVAVVMQKNYPEYQIMYEAA